MGEETSDSMNLDLNLGPASEEESEFSRELSNFDNWYEAEVRRMREARLRVRQRWRRRPARIPSDPQSISMDLDHLVINSGNMTTLQTGEGSVPAEDRTEVPKTCENNASFLEDAKSEKKDEIEKGSGSDGSFFDCNICFDLARDPVVTCCGHLFCWPCLYQWLQVYSDVKECPVCKGEVTIKTVTPIYGRGNNTSRSEEDLTLKIPARPLAHRTESFRQVFHRYFPMEDVLRQLGSRLDLTDLQPPESSDIRERDRYHPLLNRVLTSRGMRREQNIVLSSDDVNFVRDSSSSSEWRENRRLQSLLLRRAQAHRNAVIPPHTSALSSAERLVEAYFRSPTRARNEEQLLPVDDRDSFSSIAAVINSESQLDTAVEIDSLVSLSTSTSRRRGDASRISDVDSGDSRAARRRRLE